MEGATLDSFRDPEPVADDEVERSGLPVATSAPEGSVPFDYGTLPADVAAEARAAADRIRGQFDAMRQGARAALKIGVDLKAQRDCLPHGHWEPWLHAEFGMSPRTARRFIRLADVFVFDDDLVSDVPISALYALSDSTATDEVRAEIKARAAAGETITKTTVVRAKAARKPKSDTVSVLTGAPARPSASQAVITRRRNEAKAQDERERHGRHCALMIRDRFPPEDFGPFVETMTREADLGAFLDELTRLAGPQKPEPPVPLEEPREIIREAVEDVDSLNEEDEPEHEVTEAADEELDEVHDGGAEIEPETQMPPGTAPSPYQSKRERTRERTLVRRAETKH